MRSDRALRAAAIVGAITVAALLSSCASQPETPAPAPEAPAPAAAPPAAVASPAPPPAAPAPAPKKPAAVTLNSTQLFDFNKATLKPEAKAKLDDIFGRSRDLESISHVQIDGYTDRLGSQQYNQKLSERRADAVKAYLVSKGLNASKIDIIGFGKTNQVKSCRQKDRKALIECLEPNRRVVVELKGTSE